MKEEVYGTYSNSSEIPYFFNWVYHVAVVNSSLGTYQLLLIMPSRFTEKKRSVFVAYQNVIIFYTFSLAFMVYEE